MEYRKLQARAAEAARGYSGSEASFLTVMESLQALEDFAVAHAPGEAREGSEIVAAMQHNEVNPKLVNELLTLAHESGNKSMREEIANAFERLSVNEVSQKGIAVRKITGVILPPGKRVITNDHESQTESQEERFDTLLVDFINLLEQNGIFGDDIVISIGDAPSRDVRKSAYVSVEIPRLERTVLISNEVNQGTYVVRGTIPDAVLIETDKYEYNTSRLFESKMVIRGESWATRMIEVLFSDEHWKNKNEGKKIVNKRIKVDVRDMLKKRIELLRIIQEKITDVDWLSMPAKNRKKYKFGDLFLSEVGKVFGVVGDMDTVLPQLEFGLAVWPESELIQKALEIEKRTPEEWRIAVQTDITDAQWVAMGQNKRTAYKLDTKGIIFIADKLGVRGVDASNAAQYAFGLKVWSESELIQKALEIEKRTPEEWLTVLRKECNDVTWANATTEWRMEQNIDGRGLRFFKTLFGLSTTGTVQGQLEFCRIVWPNSEAIKQAIEAEARTPDQWRDVIRAQYSPENLLDMSVRKRGAEKFDGMSMRNVALLFGVEDARKIEAQLLPQLRFLQQIWPENVQIREAIQKHSQV